MTTKADQARLDVIHLMQCIACALDGLTQPSKTEAHHIVDGGYRKHSGGHQATLPLCGWHHRGEPKIGFFTAPKSAMTHGFGPSLAVSKREFVRRFGTERELLTLVNGKITEVA